MTVSFMPFKRLVLDIVMTKKRDSGITADYTGYLVLFIRENYLCILEIRPFLIAASVPFQSKAVVSIVSASGPKCLHSHEVSSQYIR